MPQEIVGFKFPFQVGSAGGPATNNSLDQVVNDSIFVICSTAKGEMEMEPEFGIIAIEQVFEPGDSTTLLALRYDLEKTLRRYEPRARVREVTMETDPSNPSLLILTVTYYNLLTLNTNQVQVEFAQVEGA